MILHPTKTMQLMLALLLCGFQSITPMTKALPSSTRQSLAWGVRSLVKTVAPAAVGFGVGSLVLGRLAAQIEQVRNDKGKTKKDKMAAIKKLNQGWGKTIAFYSALGGLYLSYSQAARVATEFSWVQKFLEPVGNYLRITNDQQRSPFRRLLPPILLSYVTLLSCMVTRYGLLSNPLEKWASLHTIPSEASHYIDKSPLASLGILALTAAQIYRAAGGKFMAVPQALAGGGLATLRLGKNILTLPVRRYEQTAVATAATYLIGCGAEWLGKKLKSPDGNFIHSGTRIQRGNQLEGLGEIMQKGAALAGGALLVGKAISPVARPVLSYFGRTFDRSLSFGQRVKPLGVLNAAVSLLYVSRNNSFSRAG